MSDEMREMTLEEYLRKLPPNHRAIREWQDLFDAADRESDAEQALPAGYEVDAEHSLAERVAGRGGGRVSGRTLFDAEEGRDVGIARAYAASDEGWRSRALEVTRHVARHQREFIVDEVWERLDKLGVPRPKEGRAMAGVLRQVEAEGLIEKTGRFRKSAQAQCHANPRMVWRVR